RDLVVLEISQDHVLVSPVVVGHRSHLGPLPAEIGDRVGPFGILGNRVALPDRLDRLVPRARGGRGGVGGGRAWRCGSVMDQKSSAEQWRAKSHASAPG